MSRRDELKKNSPNPAAHFLEWKSLDKNFKYWDKEYINEDKTVGANQTIELPFKFLCLMEFVTIKGWHDPSQSSIYSNEIQDISKEEIHVRSFKGGTIAKGLYSEIKEDVYREGGKYHKSIYIMSEKGVLLNISFKSTHAFEWGEFYKGANKQRALDEWTEIYDTEERKKGSNTFHVPKFKFNGIISEQDNLTGEILYKDLKEYMAQYLQPNEKEVTEQVYNDANNDAAEIVQPEPVVQTDDDLPF